MEHLLSSFLRDVGNGYVAHWCPACKELHLFFIGTGPPPKWTFNGDVEKPTFSPSMLIREAGHICHYFLTDGMLHFCSDCDAHALANQSVPLPELPYWMLEETASEAECSDQHFYELLGGEAKHKLDGYIHAHWHDETHTYREWQRLAKLECDGWVDSML